MTEPRTTLVLGGARSGKSAYAEGHVEALGPQRLYLATGTADDPEMATRIAAHRKRRGSGWSTVEEPIAIAGCLDKADCPVLLDCLTLWLSNLMMAERDLDVATSALADALAIVSHPVTLVSNEIGMGLVPDTQLGRAFRDAQGRLNQQMAAICDQVVFVAAGLPLVLKDATK